MIDYNRTARQILNNVGGIKNFDSCSTCATRLKLFVKVRVFVNYERLENIDGVRGVFESLGVIQLIMGRDVAGEVASKLNNIVAIERNQKRMLRVAKQSTVIENPAPIEGIVNMYCPTCNNRLYGNNFCMTCMKFVNPAPYRRNILSDSTPHTGIYKAPLNVSTTNEQNRSVTINNYNIYIENLNINGLTFNQIIQNNGSNQQVLRTITDRVVVFENFITYITRRIQYNNEMAWDVIIILKSDADTGIRSLGYSMQRELYVDRNPLAKLRNWILQHKEDMDVAKKFFDALSSAASFVQKWGPWLAKGVGG